MKNLFISMLVLLLVGILATGALAQDTPKNQKQNFDGDQGISDDPHGDSNRHDFKDDDPVNGPHGPMTDNADGNDKVFIDEDGDGFSDCETRVRQGDMAGTMVRTENKKGAMNQDRTGGSEGIDDGADKAFDGEDGEGTMTGSRKGNINDWGPGGDEPAMGDGVGPNEDGVGFGEAEDMDEGEGSAVRSRGNSRK